MIDHILLTIACGLLGVIAFRKPSTTTIHNCRDGGVVPRSDAAPEPAQQPEAPVEGDGIVDTESEYVLQERFIDDWVTRNCEPTHDDSEKQHQRWEGLRHYKNRTRR